MSGLLSFRGLSHYDQALLCVAVLLDGGDAIQYLSFDKKRGPLFEESMKELLELSPEVRIPYAGTILRSSLELAETLQQED